MPYLLLVLFFWSPYISLTPNAVEINSSCVDISATPLMAAKGDGAAVIVRLPFATSEGWPNGVNERWTKINKDFPAGRVKATLYRANGSDLHLVQGEETAIASDNFDLVLKPSRPFSKSDEFVRIKLCADPSIRGAHVFWRRFRN